MRPPSVVVLDVNETLSDLRPMGQRFAELARTRPWHGCGSPRSCGTRFRADRGPEHRHLPGPRGRPAASSCCGSARGARRGAGGSEQTVEHVLSRFMGLPLHRRGPGRARPRRPRLRLVTLSNGSAEVAEACSATRACATCSPTCSPSRTPGCRRAGARRLRSTPPRSAAPAPGHRDGRRAPLGRRRRGPRRHADRVGRPRRPSLPSYATPPDHLASLVELARTLGA